jgi:hypothetical protein
MQIRKIKMGRKLAVLSIYILVKIKKKYKIEFQDGNEMKL